MKKITLVNHRNQSKYIYRIGKRKAECFIYSHGVLISHNVEITPEQAEKDVQELRRSGWALDIS